MPIKVLIVDDSALVRKLLTEMLSTDKEIEVVGTANDPYAARDKIKRLNPDVITLDVEMPRMDGITFLRNLMRLRPMPVVMVSTLTEKGADVTMQALELGAVDFVTKPKVDMAHKLEDYTAELIEKVKMAALAQVQPLTDDAERTTPKEVAPLNFRTTDMLIVIGASAGGTEALKVLLSDMPPDSPGIVITLHIPPVFSASFAQRMNTISPMVVQEATHNQQVKPGHVYVAPGDQHMEIIKDGAMFRTKLYEGPRVCRHIPSVDVLYRSVAKNIGKNCIGVIMTGMGRDGSEALCELKKIGAHTIAQDEKTSVVWGMAGEAVAQGCATEILPLKSIAPRLIHLSKLHAQGKL